MTRRGTTTRSLPLLAVALVCTCALSQATGCSQLNRPAEPVVTPSAEVTTTTASAKAAASALTTPTIPLAGKVEPPATGAYLGVYVPPAPFKIEKVDEFTQAVGKEVSIVMWYQPWATTNRSQFDAGACIAVMRRGKVPLITWEPWNPGSNANNVRNPSKQPAFRLKAINDGTYDEYLRSWARQMRDLGGPIMLRPMHEMNGDWYPWSGTSNGNTPKEFVQAWRHMHDIFVEEGATNVTWVWSINHEPSPNTPQNSYAAYYPGDAYVDWTAISGFNWGTSSPYSSWHTFSHWYDKPLAYLRDLHKPIIIAEFATVEQGGDKAAWLTDAYGRIKTYPYVDAVIYYNALEKGSGNQQDWRVGTSEKSSVAFRKAIAPDYFVGGPPAALSSWATTLTTDEWQYLGTLLPVY